MKEMKKPLLSKVQELSDRGKNKMSHISSSMNISTPSSDPTSITTPTIRTTKAVSPPLTLSLNHFQLSLILHSHSNFYHCLTLVLTGSTQAFSLGNLPVFIPLSPGKKLDPVTCILLVLIINTHSQPTFM